MIKTIKSQRFYSTIHSNMFYSTILTFQRPFSRSLSESRKARPTSKDEQFCQVHFTYWTFFSLSTQTLLIGIFLKSDRKKLHNTRKKRRLEFKSDSFFLQPYVDNPGEQDFLMAQLNSLSAIEAKSLLHTLLHRTIDLRMRGKSTDLELRKKDEEERTNKKKFRYMNDLCLFLDRNVKKQDRDKDKLKAEVEYWKEKAAKYKKYYVYHQNSTKSANDSLKNEEKSHEEAVKLPVSSAKNIKFEGNRLIFEPESKSRIRHTTRHK